MKPDYPEKPPGLDPRIKARQGFIRFDEHGGQIGNIEWTNGDPAGVQLQMEQSDGSRWPVCFFGKVSWSRFGWPITGYTDDVEWVLQSALRRARYMQMEA